VLLRRLENTQRLAQDDRVAAQGAADLPLGLFETLAELDLPASGEGRCLELAQVHLQQSR
jgi:hypothetical protein